MDVIGPIHTLLGWESWAEISAIFMKKRSWKKRSKQMAKKKTTSNIGIHPIGANKDLTLAGAKDPIFMASWHQLHHQSPRSSFAFITCLTRMEPDSSHELKMIPLPWPFSLQNGESMILYQINSGIQNDWPFKMTQICGFCSRFLNRFCNIQIAMWTGHSGQTSETQDRYCLNYRVFLQVCIVSHENAV